VIVSAGNRPFKIDRTNRKPVFISRTGAVLAVAFSPDGKQIALSGGQDFRATSSMDVATKMSIPSVI
jgi:Tol biopolymer transport system component